jgi:hypothetical protein
MKKYLPSIIFIILIIFLIISGVISFGKLPDLKEEMKKPQLYEMLKQKFGDEYTYSINSLIIRENPPKDKKYHYRLEATAREFEGFIFVIDYTDNYIIEDTDILFYKEDVSIDY